MGRYLTRLESDFISRSVDLSSARLIVDVGAEAGRFSLLAAKSNAMVIGVDIDSYSLHRLKQKNKDVTVIQGDARKIPLRTGIFDAILMVEVLDYIPELSEALDECNRILKLDSPLVFTFGNSSSLKAKLRKFRGKSYLHSYKRVRGRLLDSGFTVEEKMGYSWLPVGRMSENPLVPFLAGLERVFGLRRLPSLSPWVMLKVTKSS